jgi:hypothetical protein
MMDKKCDHPPIRIESAQKRPPGQSQNYVSQRKGRYRSNPTVPIFVTHDDTQIQRNNESQ